MAKRPLLLDLFCGAGGCAVGYHRAGFDVVGVDHMPQPSYPFLAAAPRCAMDTLRWLLDGGPVRFMVLRGDKVRLRDQRRLYLDDFDAIHASPPCQRYTVGRKIHNSGDRHPDLVDPCRELLKATGKPWVMENVPGAPLRDPAVLCGLMFGLRVLRHRLFEASFLLLAPAHQRHPKGDLTGSCKGYSTGANGFVTVAGNNFVREAGAAAMGIDWMKRRPELAQAIPPAYTEFVGGQLMTVITGDT